jgi:hypothetical protein
VALWYFTVTWTWTLAQYISGHLTFCIEHTLHSATKCCGNRVTYNVFMLAFMFTTNWMMGVQSPAKAKDFSSSLCVQASSEGHQVSYPMGNRDPFPGIKNDRGVTLTTHPIQCWGLEWVGAILPLTLSACMASSRTTLLYFFFLVYFFHVHYLSLVSSTVLGRTNVNNPTLHFDDHCFHLLRITV